MLEGTSFVHLESQMRILKIWKLQNIFGKTLNFEGSKEGLFLEEEKKEADTLVVFHCYPYIWREINQGFSWCV